MTTAPPLVGQVPRTTPLCVPASARAIPDRLHPGAVGCGAKRSNHDAWASPQTVCAPASALSVATLGGTFKRSPHAIAAELVGGEGAMMAPGPEASTHKARSAAFEGATQLREGSPRVGPRVGPHRACPGGATDSPLPPAAPTSAPTGLAPVEPQIPHYPRSLLRRPPPGLPRWSLRFPTTPVAPASAPTGLAPMALNCLTAPNPPCAANFTPRRSPGEQDACLPMLPAGARSKGPATTRDKGAVEGWLSALSRRHLVPLGLPRWSLRFPTTPGRSCVGPHRACPGGASDSPLPPAAPASAPTGLAPVEPQIPHYPRPLPRRAPPGLLEPRTSRQHNKTARRLVRIAKCCHERRNVARVAMATRLLACSGSRRLSRPRLGRRRRGRRRWRRRESRSPH